MRTERPGRRIFAVSWSSNVVFALVVVPVALGIDALDTTAIGVSVALFLLSLPVWGYAFLVAAGRSARGEDVTVGRLFLADAAAPRDAQWQLYGALAASISIAAATAAANPFGVLVPMLSLGFVGLWGARHGRYPPRPAYPRGRPGGND